MKTPSFIDAKNQASKLIIQLADSIEPLQMARGVSGSKDIVELMKWEQALRLIEFTLSRKSAPFNCEKEITEIDRFGSVIVNLIPGLENQLHDFWNLWFDAIEEWNKNPDQYEEYNWWSLDTEKVSQLENSDKMAEDLVDAIKDSPRNLSHIHALLTSHVSRVESAEYVLVEIIKDTITTFSLSSYDPYQMCSVRDKVEKGNKWKTDVRAIRDAISHSKYKIVDNNQDCEIIFSNNEQGYNFNWNFECSEFIRFFDKHTCLYKLQIDILRLLELLSLFKNFLCSF
ncbi:MAG: hypothetical protein ACTSU7_01655 [Candidatus Heimdallarchaeaceae archaeon]